MKDRGASIDYTPTVAVVEGEVIGRSDLVGVAPMNIAANEAGSIAVEGVFDIVKTSALAIAVGDNVYFNPVTNEANKTAGVRALGVLTFTGVGVAAQTIVVGTRTYTWRASPTLPDELLIGTQAACEAAFASAINNGILGGLPHAVVTAADVGSTVVLTAIDFGTAANGGSTVGGTNMAFGATTLGAGTGGHTAGAGGPKVGKCVLAAANPSSLVRVKLKQ
jgi:predicted RecA/RadA family phage recombinase